MFEIANLEKKEFLFNKQLKAFSNYREYHSQPSKAYLIETRLSDMIICHWRFFESYEIEDILNNQLMIVINTVPFKIFELLLRDKEHHFEDNIYKSYEP